jgi:NitT/TauT family transport system substrate-binding protein
MRLRRALLAVLCVCAVPSARAAETVKVGIINSLSDVTLFMAIERGYFREQGLEVDPISMDSGGKMIAPLGSGELDAGGGASSAGLFNALDRGIDIRVVADRTTTWPESEYQAVVIRKALVDSGQVKTLADLKGRTFGVAAPGIGILAVIDAAAQKGGIQYGDIKKVYMSFAEQLVALSNGAIDGIISIEPYGTMAADAGIGVQFMNTETFFPRDEIGMVFYSEAFAHDHAATATRYMVAYLHASRDFMASVKDGRIQGPGADFVLGVLSRHLGIKPDLGRRIWAQRVDPDGQVNVASLRRDWEFYRAQGLIKGVVPPEKVVDMRFAEAAVKVLGPAQPDAPAALGK